MTTPSERARALRWGADLLRELVDHPLTSPTDRELAVGLLPFYPTPDVIEGWIESKVRVIPVEAARAIEGAGNLFRHLHFDEHSPPELRETLRYTLRHFPQPGWAMLWISPGPSGFLGLWLALDSD